LQIWMHTGSVCFIPSFFFYFFIFINCHVSTSCWLVAWTDQERPILISQPWSEPLTVLPVLAPHWMYLLLSAIHTSITCSLHPWPFYFYLLLIFI
jgi:hypothetical protein